MPNPFSKHYHRLSIKAVPVALLPLEWRLDSALGFTIYVINIKYSQLSTSWFNQPRMKTFKKIVYAGTHKIFFPTFIGQQTTTKHLPCTRHKEPRDALEVYGKTCTGPMHTPSCCTRGTQAPLDLISAQMYKIKGENLCPAYEKSDHTEDQNLRAQVSLIQYREGKK